MKDEIKEILDYLKNNTFIPDECKRKYKLLCKDDNKKLLDYITNLEQERDKFKLRCYKSLKLIRDNYGLLDKYGIDMLHDILTGGDNNE